MANNFRVKTKTKSLRCEICHQTDQFDVDTEICLRCQSLVISNLVPQTNNHFQDWMVNLGATQRETLFPIREIFTVLRQGLRLYWQRFFLFFSLTATVLIPLGFLTEDFTHYQLGITDSFYRLAIVYGVPFVITSLTIGAINLAIFESSQNQQTSFLSVYSKLFSRGFRFFFTSIVGQVYQLIGVWFCFLGVLYTFPSGAFASETAIVEQKYGMEAFRASHRMGMRAPIFLLFLGLFNLGVPRLGSDFIASLFINNVKQYGISLDDLAYLTLICLQVFIFPLFLIIKMLTYLRLRPQESEPTQSTVNSRR